MLAGEINLVEDLRRGDQDFFRYTAAHRAGAAIGVTLGDGDAFFRRMTDPGGAETRISVPSTKTSKFSDMLSSSRLVREIFETGRTARRRQPYRAG